MNQLNQSSNSVISYAVKNTTKPVKSFRKATYLHLATELNMLDAIKATITYNAELLYICEYEYFATQMETLLLCNMVPSLPCHIICEMAYRLL